MLKLKTKGMEQWDERKNEFVYSKSYALQLEHSLVSVSKWEQKYNKAFFSKKDKTQEEWLYYFQCMTINQNIPEEAYSFLTKEDHQQIFDYMNEQKTAVYFRDNPNKNRTNNKDSITAELIRHWMIALTIPMEFSKWHINSLFAQIRVCDMKNNPNKKMNKRDMLNDYASLNKLRKNKLGSKG